VDWGAGEGAEDWGAGWTPLLSPTKQLATPQRNRLS